jgi:tRNA (mo5U34)-methyltransferase
MDGLTTQRLADRAAALSWWHQIEIAPGLVTPGAVPLKRLQADAATYFGGGVHGLSVLDIGCWDGFNSLEAARRGASRVLATDHWVWAHHPTATRRTIELVREVAAPNMEIEDIDLPDISPASLGTFDLVLFAGVLYHLRDMLSGLERAASVTTRTLIVETHLDMRYSRRPRATFCQGASLNNDGSNWWIPNRRCVEHMLAEVGFHHIGFTRSGRDRAIFHAHRDASNAARR